MKFFILFLVITAVCNVALAKRKACRPQNATVPQQDDPAAFKYTPIADEYFTHYGFFDTLISFGGDYVAAQGAKAGEYPDNRQFFAMGPANDVARQTISKRAVGDSVYYKFDDIRIEENVDAHSLPEYTLTAKYIVRYTPSSDQMQVVWYNYIVNHNERYLPYVGIDQKEIKTDKQVQDRLNAGVAEVEWRYENQVDPSDEDPSAPVTFTIKHVKAERQVRSDGTSYRFDVVLERSIGGEASLQFGEYLFGETYWIYQDEDRRFTPDQYKY